MGNEISGLGGSGYQPYRTAGFARVLAVVLVALVAGLRQLPPWAVLVLAVIVQLLVLLLAVFHQLNRWRARHVGEPFNLLQFVGLHGAPILVSNGFVLGALLLLSDGVLAGLGETGAIRSAALGAVAILVAGGIGWAVVGSMVLGGNPWLQSVRQRCDLMPLSQQVHDSWQFCRYVAPRIGTALGRLLLGAVLANLLAGGLIVLALSFGVEDSLIGLVQGKRWAPWAMWVSMLVAICGAWVAASALLGMFRVVQRARRSGFLKQGVLAREAGLAFESVGFVPTIVWVLLNLTAVGSLAAASWLAARTFIGSEGEALIWSSVAALTAVGVLAWVIVFLPQMYVFAILSRRDCGWSRAFDASMELVQLEGIEALLKAVLVTIFSVTIVGIPAAIHLLVCGLDRQDTLLAAILGEKSRREIEEALARTATDTPEALAKPTELLEKGRYLDALNGFQLYRFNNPQDARAMRGEALAMLAMGHVKGREVLERWASEEPDNPEAAETLREFNAGLWGPDGARFLEAKARCTQPLGRGV
ncbi:hypothetical protein GC173_17710 [bacterium]|nr:hypothetical protein [bacterium]